MPPATEAPEHFHRPQARCGLGFSCALMMQCPGLQPADCENYRTCGSAIDYPPGVEFTLLRWGEGGPTPWQVNRARAAVSMLLQRGAPQTPADFGLVDLFDRLTRGVAHQQEQLERMHGYIPPPGAYLVTERRGRQTRLRLAPGRTFAAVREGICTRAIHLGRPGSQRAEEARAGLDRRRRLVAADQLVARACRNLEAGRTLLVGGPAAAITEQAILDDGSNPGNTSSAVVMVDDGTALGEQQDGAGGVPGSVLLARGAHRRLATSRLTRRLTQVEQALTEIRISLERFAPPGVYIAPPDCEAHRYNVKRPGRDAQGKPIVRIFWHNKLASRQALFAPAHKLRPVTVVHLSRDDDPRNREARAGIERRNLLRRLVSRLRAAATSIEAACATLCPYPTAGTS